MLSREQFSRLREREKGEYIRGVKRGRGVEDLIYFVKEVLGYKEVEEGVHGKLIEVLKGGRRRKLVMLPRGSFKSSIGTIGNVIQKFLINPNIRVLIDSEVLENSEKFLEQIKKHIEKESFVELYGEVLDRGRRETAREFTVKRGNRNLKEPTVYATGIGTVNVGMHYDFIVADDLHSEKNVGTREQMEKVIAHYRLLLSLLEPDGELLIIGTKWHYDDLYAFIEEENEGKWEIYKEKAIREDGSLFFPNRLSREFLSEMRIAQGAYLWSCQYQNEAVDSETAVFKRSYFKYWGKDGDFLPEKDGNPVLLNIYIAIDRAFSTKESADYTGIVVAGISSNGSIYVLEAERDRCGLQKLCDIVFKFFDKYGAGRVRRVALETLNWEEAYQFFQEQMTKRNKFFILERFIPQGKQNKQGRIETALAARYANGVIYHRKGMIDLEDELSKFPSSVHDDCSDALSMLISMMSKPGDPTFETDKIEYEPSGFFGETGY